MLQNFAKMKDSEYKCKKYFHPINSFSRKLSLKSSKKQKNTSELHLSKPSNRNVNHFVQSIELIKSNNGILYIDFYHHYFVAAMTNQKTKELACTKYQKILRQNLFDREHLPPQMISSILSACSSTGGSTTGSSHGSANISTSSQQGQNLYVVNLIKTILLKTPQSSSQIQLALTYILQGTRNKRFNSFFSSILQEIYNNLLVKIRQEPVKRLVHLQINHLVNQIEYHLGIYDQDPSWKINKVDENGKKVMCVHDQRGGKGKFGKCYFCGKQADNYCKDEMVPICSFDCKFKLKQIVDSENNQDHFNLLGWLIENLPSNDEIIYSFLGRELVHHKLNLNDIVSILKIIINIFTACASQRYAQHTASLNNPSQSSSSSENYVFKQIQKHALNIFLHILFNYKHLYEQQLAKYFKVFFFEIVRILELISIKRLKINEKSQKGSKGQLPASKQSLESSLNLSLDSMGNMQSLSSMAQNNPNVTSYLNYQQQFSNPFLNGIIQILSNQDLFFYIYSHFDCKFFEQNLLAKMMNIISQYAKQQIISKQYGFGITGSSAYGVYSILKMLTQRLVGYEKHKNLRTFNLDYENQQIQNFLKKYPINQKELELKRQLPKVIELFNKKPVKGIIALKKLFQKKAKSQSLKSVNLNDSLSESMIRQHKDKHEKQQQKLLTNQKDQIKNQYQKDVEEIKRKAEKLQRENLDASQLTIRQEDRSISIENLQDSTVIEKTQSNLSKQEMTEDVSMNESMILQEKQEKMSQSQQPSEKKTEIIQNQENKQKLQQSETKVQQLQQTQMKQKDQSIKQNQQKKKSSTNIDSLITSKQIAMFLRQNVDYASKLKKIPLLQKEKVAEYMGSTKDKEANQICYQFFKLDDEIYSHLDIDDCLRVELNYFGTPKQGQQIQIVIDELSKVMMPHTYFKSELHIYQYIYTLLMVNSGHNPNVKESDKVKLDMFLSMVKHIEEAKDKAQRDYHKIKKNELNNLYNWGEMVFDHKYLMKISEQDWLFEQVQSQNYIEKQQQQKDKNELINLKWLMEYIWEYVYISIVNNQKKNSTLGVFEAIVLYGKYGLVGEQFGFVEIFKRSYEFTKSKQSLQSLLRLGIEFNNYLYQWSYLINLSYVLEQSNTYHEHIDKIFTNLQYIHRSKLKIFLIALCQFSTSQYKSDKGYNRELFVLRHITEIMEYNLNRLEQVWDEIWSTIEVYFKGICLHPKRQISMAAIDSYKQLSLKIFKIKQQKLQGSHRNQPIKHSSINHSKVLETYLFIFERSNIFTKDLIINILQNVVSNDINSGWEIIYEILNINDSQDKTVVMKVVQRLVKQVGYKRLTSLEKLHQILVKQLRVNVNTPTLIQMILLRLWQVSEQIDKREVWMETMKSVKDIYKMSLNNRLLVFWFRIINKCISDNLGEQQERKRRMSFEMMKPIVATSNTIKRKDSKQAQTNYIEEINIEQVQKIQLSQQQAVTKQQQIANLPQPQDQQQQPPSRQQQINMHENNQQSEKNQQMSLDREIYTEIVDWLIFLIDGQENQSIDSRQSYILTIKQALQHFKAVKSTYLIRYLVGVSGLLSIFTMFIHSQFQTVFLLFLKQFIQQKLLMYSQRRDVKSSLLIELSPQKYLQLITWLNNHFKESIPNDLLNMKKLDDDFRKQRKDLILNINQSGQSSSPILPVLNNSEHKIQLIQFSLSAQDFNLKSISNLILLDCLNLVIQKARIKEFNQQVDKLTPQQLTLHSGSSKSISSPNSKVYKQDEPSHQLISKQTIKANFDKILTEIYQNLIENYQISRKTNNLIALRNFLWNNGFLLYNTFKENEHLNNQKDKKVQGQPTNKLIDISKQPKFKKSIPGLHKHEKRTLKIILEQLPEQDNYMLNIQVLQDFITNYRLKNCFDQEKTTKNGLKKRKRQQSLSRGRKISEIVKTQYEDQVTGLHEHKKTQNTKQMKQDMNKTNKVSQSQTTKKSQIQQKQEQQQQVRSRNQSISTQKSKHIQVIQYEKKSSNSNGNQSKPRINVIPNPKSQKSAQNELLMRQLYLNDIEQWIKSMESNLAQALNNLLRICTQAVQQRQQQNQTVSQKEIRAKKLSSFLVNDQQMVKIFLFCLDLSGQENCSLPIMRISNTLMQTLLKTVMSVQIQYGWRDASQMKDQIQEGNDN